MTLVKTTIEEALISAVCGDPERFYEQAHKFRAAYFADPRTIPIAKAIGRCLDSDILPNAVNIQAQLVEMGAWETLVKPSYFADLDNRGTSQVVAGMPGYLVQLPKAYAARTAAAKARRFADDVEADPEALGSLINGFGHDLARSMSVGLGEDDDPTLDAALNADQTEVVSRYRWGLDWLDASIGGPIPGEVTGIMGRYKGRKTTLAAYMALRAFLQGASVAWYTTADGTWLSIVNRWIAIMATQLMKQEGIGAEHWVLKPKYLDQNMQTPEQHWAIEEAKKKLRANGGDKRLRTYDVRNHRVNDLPTLIARLRRDRGKFGTDVVVIDYLQQLEMDDNPTEYELLRRATKQLLAVNLETGTHSVWLMQKNEASNSSANSRSAGVRGGSQAPAAVDTLLEPWYNEQGSPGIFGIKIWVARYAARASMAYPIEPNSGTILRPKLMPGEARQIAGEPEEPEDGPNVYDDEQAIETVAA